ncbi:MAG: 30S ribosomal protein S18 [Clostridia bacterium]|nr:30S ribosomal protein S18 [Clostridia bacterium]
MEKEKIERPIRRKAHKKVCHFCVDRVEEIDYKDVARLRKFVSERAKILPRRATGTCAKHQRELTTAIKRARQVALLPYVND